MSPAPRPGAERGSVTTFVVLLVVPVLAMSALAFDGGRLLTARRLAADTAQNAALAGAQAIAGTTVRTGRTAVDDRRVVAMAEDYLSRNDATGTVEVIGDEVEVTVTGTVRLTLLPLIRIDARTVTGRGRARLLRGVDRADEPEPAGPTTTL